jgi:DNA-binding MarR family transcriptional regulator
LTETRLPEDSAAAQETVTDRLGQASLGYQIGLISRLLAQSLKKRNGKDGILPGQFPVAIELMANDGATQRALCERVRIDQSTMAGTLKRMERNGVIERRACAHDGRQSTIHMTAKGRNLFEAAARNAADVNRIAFGSLDPSSTVDLRTALRHIADRLSQDVQTSQDVQNCNPE